MDVGDVGRNRLGTDNERDGLATIQKSLERHFQIYNEKEREGRKYRKNQVLEEKGRIEVIRQVSS